MRLLPTPAAAALARRHVADACRGRLSTESEQAARLLVSELVTNCVRHAHTPITLAVECDRTHVSVSVADDVDDEPVLRELRDDDTGGRGMHLVDALAGEWGVQHLPDGGKVVWFRLP